MTDVLVPQGSVLVTFEAFAQSLNLPQLNAIVAYNVPAENIRATYGGALAAFRQASDIKVTQASVLALVRGTISNPKLRAWTFDLDGHEFYVLRLGNDKSLIYDRTTEQWSWWSSGETPSWRVNIGTNWIQSGSVSLSSSNVVVGDDSLGMLWTLAPEQGYDDPTSPKARDEGEVRSFKRIATGQVVTRGRITIPCYQVYLTANAGQPAYAGASVTLSYSDDGGRSFVAASEPIVAEAGNYYQEFAWRSVGLVRSPGRLFRIEDDGAFAQIDELTIYDGTE